MADEDSAVDPVAALADEFLARYRRGERPAISEYTDRYPQLAERIRHVLPLLVVMEQAGSGASPSPATSAEPAGPGAPERLPERIGGYRILREVGRGGMGVVYEAEQVALGRHVALKVLPLHLASQGSGLERFRREARAAARLHHSNIVPVHEVGEDGGHCFYAMQFIRGQALDAVLEELKALRDSRSEAKAGDPPARGAALSLLTEAYRGEGPPPEAPGAAPPPSSSVNLPGQTDRSAAESGQAPYHRSVARVGVQAAEALDYAHREGVVHRDIKPSNLLLDADGRVWVADFGLAQVDGAALTLTGDVVGAVRYMAPERFRGWSDPRSDVYSLGLTLYEMLLLRPAFDGPDRVTLIHQVTHREPPRLRAADPRIPRDLETIIHKAIDKEPGRRYPTAAELAADLRRFVDDKPILARRISGAERAWRWCRRNPVVAGLAAAVVLVFFGGFAATAWQMRVAQANEQTAKDNERKATHEADETRTANGRLRDARNGLRHALYIADMNLVQAAYEADNLTLARQVLDRHRPGPGEPDERGFEWYYWERLCHQEATSVPVANALNPTAVLSPDGSRVAYLLFPQPKTQSTAEVHVVDAATGEEITSTRCTSKTPFLLEPTSLCFSPDGERIAVLAANRWDSRDGSQLTVWNTVTGEARTITDGFVFAPWYTYAFSPDGMRVAAQVEEIAPIASSGWPSRTGHIFLKVWNCSDGKGVVSVRRHTGTVGPMAFSPDGEHIAVHEMFALEPDGKRQPQRVQVFDASTGDEALAVNDASIGAYTLAFSADGAGLLASGLVEAPVLNVGRVWNAATGEVVASVSDLSATHCKVAISPDGQYVTWYGDANGRDNSVVKVRSAADGHVLTTLKGHVGAVTSVADSADGVHLVTAGTDGTVKRWELPEKGLSGSSPDEMAVSPDGTRAACSYWAGVPTDSHPNLESAIYVEDTRTRRRLLSLQNLMGSVRELEFSPDGKRLAALIGINDSLHPPRRHAGIRMWSVDTGAVTFAVDAPLDFPLASHPALVAAAEPWLCFRPDGRLLALSAPQGEQARGLYAVKAWDADSAAEVFTTGAVPYLGQVQFTPDSRRLIGVLVDSGEIKVWDADTGRERATIKTGGMFVQSLTASRTGGRIAAVAGPNPASGPAFLKVWDADTGEERASFPESIAPEQAPALELSPDGRLLAAAAQGALDGARREAGRIKIWHVGTGELVQTITGHNYPVGALAFSPDGARLASAAEGASAAAALDVCEIKLWDVAAGRQLLSAALPLRLGLFLPPYQSTRRPRIQFSTDGARMILPDQSGAQTSFTVWDATPPAPPNPADKQPRRIDGWGEVVDPGGDCTIEGHDGKLAITVPGTVHDLNPVWYKGEKGCNAPRVLRAVEGDFVLQVKATGDFRPGAEPADAGRVGFNGAGLILWLDARNYIRVERAAWTEPKTGKVHNHFPYLEHWKNGEYNRTIYRTEDVSFPGRSVYLRLERRKGEVRAGISADGRNWTYPLTPLNVDLPSAVQVGVDAVNTSKEPFTAEFEELKLTRDAPETPDEPPPGGK
jgi:serine/threonine protein kinase/WD40 repeat protein/regulation of enolase protein 1 (concanavalin A-like superfamily)